MFVVKLVEWSWIIDYKFFSKGYICIEYKFVFNGGIMLFCCIRNGVIEVNVCCCKCVW